jgi:acetyltransferase-like isoleucine patch superfamily enzyme
MVALALLEAAAPPMSHVAVFLGDFRDVDTRRSKHYFEARWTFLDCRGKVTIAEDAHFGYAVKVLSATHRYNPFAEGDAVLGRPIQVPVIIENSAWICSHALLYRCKVGHHSVVAAGAVVKAAQVPPWSLVEGNPARIVGMFDYHRDGRLYYLPEPISLKGF